MDKTEIDKFILEEFGGVTKDFPWEKDPEYAVYRHADNRKWFAIQFFASKEQLLRLKPDDPILNDYDAGAKVLILDIKVEPEMIDDIIRDPGFLPAYHMNRTHWITIILDKRVDAFKIKALVEISYNLTAKKYSKNKINKGHKNEF